jgi:hypothetical protein
MEELGRNDEGEGAKGGKGEGNRPGASRRRKDGGKDGGDGGDGGGREELLSYYCTGERHGSLASRSGVTILSSHNYYCYLFLGYHRRASHPLVRRPETQGDGENPPRYSTLSFSDERRCPLSAPRPLPCRDAVARGVREGGRPFKSIDIGMSRFCPPKPHSGCQSA